jgi:hypothetical protein
MKILDTLNPKWIGLMRANSGEGVEFDCPFCGPTHRLAAYFSNPLDGNPPAPWLLDGRPVWDRDGREFCELTLEPSLHYPCWHGWIDRGGALHVSEATHLLRMPDGQIAALSPAQVRRIQAQRGKSPS